MIIGGITLDNFLGGAGGRRSLVNEEPICHFDFAAEVSE